MNKYGVVYSTMFGKNVLEFENLEDAKKYANEHVGITNQRIDVIEFITAFVSCSKEVDINEENMKLKENGE